MNIRHLLLFIICTLIYNISISNADEISNITKSRWKYYSKNGTGSKFYYDNNSILKNGNRVNVWTKIDVDKNFSKNLIFNKNDNVKEIRTLYIIDCTENKSTSPVIKYYDSNGVNIESSTIKNIDDFWIYIEPESTVDDLRSVVCKKNEP